MKSRSYPNINPLTTNFYMSLNKYICIYYIINKYTYVIDRNLLCVYICINMYAYVLLHVYIQYICMYMYAYIILKIFYK